MSVDFSIIEWINIGLRKETLANAVDALRSGRKITAPPAGNSKYIEKILREEAVKQFNDPRRPLLEIILNGVDANKDRGSQQKVEIKTHWSKFTTQDWGKGMGYDDVLRELIIPFSTEKQGIDEIGQFGVGFLSTFGYCLKYPRSGKVIVESNNGVEAIGVRFYATSDDIADLRMTLGKGKRREQGTVVFVKPLTSKDDYVGEYLRTNLSAIPSYVANISLNGHPLNQEVGGAWVTAPALIKRESKNLMQRVGLRISASDGPAEENIVVTGKVLVASQGVPVKTVDGAALDITVSLPSGARLVEGRDEFKIDENYHVCVASAFEALALILKDKEYWKRAIAGSGSLYEPNLASVTTVIPAMMRGLGIYDLRQVPHIGELRDIMLPGKKYVTTPLEYHAMQRFFGEDSTSSIFATSSLALMHWAAVYKSDRAFVEHLAAEGRYTRIASSPAREFIEYWGHGMWAQGSALEKEIFNISGFKYELRRDCFSHLNEVCFVRAPVGKSALMSSKNVLYINAAHPYVTSASRNSCYCLADDFMSLAVPKSFEGNSFLRESFIGDMLEKVKRG